MLWSRSPQSEKMRAEKQSNAGAGSRFRHLKRLKLPNNGGQVKACCCDSGCFRVSGLKSNGTEFASVLSVIPPKRGGTGDADYAAIENPDNPVPKPSKLVVHEISLYSWLD